MEDDNSNNNNNGGDETPQIPLSSHDNHDPDQYIQYPNFFFNSPLTPSNDNPLMNPLSSLINQQQQQLLHDTNIHWVTLFSSTNPNSTNNSLGSIFGDHNQSNQLLPLSSSSLSPLAGMAASSSSTSSAVTRLGQEGEEENGAGGNKENKLGKVMSSRSKKRVNRPTRFAFQTRSADDILDDGFRWRKYGQKAVKNSIYPRSYYRCTHHTCNVKKQIQRLSKDTGIVVTTYEGVHNHPCEKLMESLTPLLRQMQFLSRF